MGFPIDNYNAKQNLKKWNMCNIGLAQKPDVFTWPCHIVCKVRKGKSEGTRLGSNINAALLFCLEDGHIELKHSEL